MKEKIIDQVRMHKIIAIIRGVAKEKLVPLTEAMYAAGIRLLEITYDASGVVSDEETAGYIELLSKTFEGRMYIGAGTVMSVKQVKLTKKAGGKFIISPDTNKKVIRATIKEGLVSMPGAMTPTEIAAASEYGADFIKLFPTSTLSPEYVKAIKAPLSNVKLLGVGGIDLDNMKKYYQAGVCGFGLGSSLANKAMIDNDDFEGITNATRVYVEMAESL